LQDERVETTQTEASSGAGTDIVVPVHNSWHHARLCLESILRSTQEPFHLYLVDDGSDTHTHRQIDQLATAHSEVATVLHNPQSLGYLRSINLGIQAGSQPNVVLLNSDVVVSQGWLTRLLQPFADDPSVGVINPVSNWANWTRIPFAPGFTIHTYADFIARVGDRVHADIYNASGFCFAARRALFEQLGLFDEIFSPGYWEETDFCLRAMAQGHRVVVNLGSFVYHFGWGSFQAGGRNEWLERNKQVFMERWGPQFEEFRERWKADRPLARLEESIQARYRELQEPDCSMRGILRRLRLYGPMCTARALTACLSSRIAGTDSERAPGQRFIAKWDKATSLSDTGRPAEDDKRWRSLTRRLVATTSKKHRHLRSRSADSQLRVVYLLPALKLYGGIISALQIVNSLALAGVDANVATCGETDADLLRGFPLYVSPYQFPSRSVMMENLPECDIVVATRWDTVYDAILLQKTRPGLRLAYFVQDYEPDFYPLGSQLSRRAELTYHLIDTQIVKTRWLARKLARFGAQIVQIPLGLNLDIFYDAQDPARHECTRVVAMARPTSKYRNYEGMLRVFSALHAERPDLRLSLYGTELDPASLPFPCDSHGCLYRMSDVAALLNGCSILLDCSTFQGFGRPGLEAMATGTAAVLTRNGGITEYAKHDYNCLLADQLDVEENVAKVLQLADDAELRRRLVDKGLQTAEEYDARLEGERTLSLLRSLLDRGSPPPQGD